MKEKIETTLKKVLPASAFINVQPYKGCFGDNYIAIEFAVSDYNINQVRGQKIQMVSLSLKTKTLELQPQVFGGNGGQSISRKPNLGDPKEKYLYCKGIKIPFKKPMPVEKNVLAAIERFAQNWVKALKENKEVLMYQELVNYDEFLK